MIEYAEEWIAENRDEFKEEGSEAKIRRIQQEEASEFGIAFVGRRKMEVDEYIPEMQIRKKIEQTGHFLKGCKYRRKFPYKRICNVDCKEVKGELISVTVTLDDKTNHTLLPYQLRLLGFEEWKEVFFCIHHSNLKKGLKKTVKSLVQVLPIEAKMMNEITVDECYQSFIGLTSFRSPDKQRNFVRCCKEVLVGNVEEVPDGIIFEDLKYYEEPVQGLCYLKKGVQKYGFKSYDNM